MSQTVKGVKGLRVSGAPQGGHYPSTCGRTSHSGGRSASSGFARWPPVHWDKRAGREQNESSRPTRSGDGTGRGPRRNGL